MEEAGWGGYVRGIRAIINGRARTTMMMMIWSCFPAPGLRCHCCRCHVRGALCYLSHCYASRGHTSNFIDTLLGSGGCPTSQERTDDPSLFQQFVTHGHSCCYSKRSRAPLRKGLDCSNVLIPIQRLARVLSIFEH